MDHVRFGSLADIEASRCDVRFPPKADIGRSLIDVRFVPKADIDLRAELDIARVETKGV